MVDNPCTFIYICTYMQCVHFSTSADKIELQKLNTVPGAKYIPTMLLVKIHA